MIFKIWWLYVLFISPIVTETFEIVKAFSVSNYNKIIYKFIFIWEYG